MKPSEKNDTGKIHGCFFKFTTPFTLGRRPGETSRSLSPGKGRRLRASEFGMRSSVADLDFFAGVYGKHYKFRPSERRAA